MKELKIDVRGRLLIFLAFWINICQDGAAKINEAHMCHSGHKNLIYGNYIVLQ